MTWLGDPAAKKTGVQREKLEAKRLELVSKIEALGKVSAKSFRFPHQARQHQEDLTKLALEVTKIDNKLGRPVDRNSGGE